MKRILQLCSFGICFAVLSCTQPGGGPSQQEAMRILEETGVQGGLVVHVGCGNGELTSALHRSDGYLVQGLDSDPENVAQAREQIRSLGLYGRVSADILTSSQLPFVDNLVNLVVSENLGNISKNEVMRVLSPEGVAYVQENGEWVKTVKPRPKEIDEWTHYWHDETGNAVAQDTVVGPPRHLQWVGSPRWSRHHDHMASMSAMVSAGGRVFYIMDEGPKASVLLPPKWFLSARDAFNGTVLWKRPIDEWNTHLWPLKSGPAQLPRRLVASKDTVYTTLGINAPVSALNAATGETVNVYPDTENTEEIIFSQGVLLLLVNKTHSKWTEYRPKHTYVWNNRDLANYDWAWDEKERTIMGIDAGSKKLLWKQDSQVAPLTLASDNQSVYFYDGKSAFCLDRLTGEQRWKSEPIERQTPITTGYAPRLVVYKDVVVFSGGLKSMTALSAKTGEALWKSGQDRSGHWSPEDVLIINDLVWSGATAGGRDTGVFTGRDLRTGEVVQAFPPDVETYWFHQRCYPSKATEKFLMPSRTGIEFVEHQAETWDINHWVRGGCIYGVMPSNGLVYAPPHSCACYIESKLYGINALGPTGQTRKPLESISDESRLEKGPAYGTPLATADRNEDDWPTYRHDSARSGFTKASLPESLSQQWKTNLGGKLTSVVAAGGKVFLASTDSHTVYALSAESGSVSWSYTTGARVDSPPTIYKGMVLFGSADGWVYCLKASDGQLVWRFRAAPEDLRLVAFEQVESVWPVHGSVLVQDDVVYCVAGRSMFLDGGLHLLRLDPQTGRKLSETVLDEIDPSTGENLQAKVEILDMPVALPDILSSDGDSLYMRSQRFDLEGIREEIGPIDVANQEREGVHLFSTTGFLDDSWFHRSYWIYGRTTSAGWGGWFRAGQYVPSGRVLVMDDEAVYGYGRKPEYMCQSSVLEYMIYSAHKEVKDDEIQRVLDAWDRMNEAGGKRNSYAADFGLRKEFPFEDRTAVGFNWIGDNPSIQAQAMILADETLFMAGPPDVVDEEEIYFRPDDPQLQEKLREQRDALEGSKGSHLWAVSAADGAKIAEYELEALPVFDGMAASGGQLYVALRDGNVLCLGGD